MKKSIIYLVCLAFLLLLTACGNQASSAPETTPAPKETVAASTTEAIVPATEALPEETAAPTEAAPAFDTSWARNAFETLLPQPPLTNSWYGTQKNETAYDIQINYATQEALESYVSQLEALGFQVSQLTDSKYLTYNAEDNKGNTFRLFFHDSAEKINITINALSPLQVSTELVEAWSDNSFEQQIPQPPIDMPTREWKYIELENKVWYMKSYDSALLGTTAAHFDAYTDALYRSGYTAALHYEVHNAYRLFSAVNEATNFYVEVYTEEVDGNAIFTVAVYDLNADLGDYFPHILDGTPWGN